MKKTHYDSNFLKKLDLDEFISRFEDVRSDLISRKRKVKLSKSDSQLLLLLNNRLDELMPVGRPPGYIKAMQALAKLKKMLKKENVKRK